MFYLSAIPAGLAVTIMAIYLCVRSLNARVDMSILSDASPVIGRLLAMYGVFRVVDLVNRDATSYLWMWREETLLLWLEIALLVVIPLVLLNQEMVRNNPLFLYWTSAVIVMGFMTNRLNVSITALQSSSAVYYTPKWTEFAATFATITAAVVAFRYGTSIFCPRTHHRKGGWWRLRRPKRKLLSLSTGTPGQTVRGFFVETKVDAGEGCRGLD